MPKEGEEGQSGDLKFVRGDKEPAKAKGLRTPVLYTIETFSETEMDEKPGSENFGSTSKGSEPQCHCLLDFALKHKFRIPICIIVFMLRLLQRRQIVCQRRSSIFLETRTWN